MNYVLNNPENKNAQSSWQAMLSLLPLIATEKRILFFATVATLINAIITLSAPLIIAYVVDVYIIKLQFSGVIRYGVILLALYSMGLVVSYFQTKLMGGVGQRVLFTLRANIFSKLQELPVQFFNVNKTGDLISRINNDTDKLNQFFSQTLVQLVGSIVSMFGSALLIVLINAQLGFAALVPAIFIFIVTLIISPWIKKVNAFALKSTGDLTAEVSESISNFKIIVAFNRQDFFKERFAKANQANYNAAIAAGVASNALAPIFNFASNAAQLIVLAYGIYLVSVGVFSIGFLVSGLAYTNNVYSPLRQLATLWSNFQVALAGWDRISVLLQLQSNLVVLPKSTKRTAADANAILSFSDVSFSYDGRIEILHKIHFDLYSGKTYAFVGPTGGGKSTTAALMARLFDPSSGIITLCGRDIRTYTPEERADKIGVILQEPILFSGTIRDNILYSNTVYKDYTNTELTTVIEQAGLQKLLTRFEGGLESKVTTTSDTFSLGQKQIISFMRAVLRQPKLLILDEATANIDTVTEQLLDEILQKLPVATTKVVIAHRLNTIEHADEIFFINSGSIVKAGSLHDAVAMLQNNIRKT